MDGNALAHRRYVWSDVTGELLTDERASANTGEFYGIYWAANDHQNTVGQLLDDTEKIAEHREYDAFGAIDAVYSEMGGSRPVGLMFSDVAHSGRIWDDDAQLYENNARWYDPHTGRFISEDPIQEGANWYRYAGNDPINFRDPTGLSPAGNPLNNLFGGRNVVDVGPVRYDNPIGLQSLRSGLGYTGIVSAGAGPLNINYAGPTNTSTIARYQGQVDALVQQRSGLNSQIATARNALAKLVGLGHLPSSELAHNSMLPKVMQRK